MLNDEDYMNRMDFALDFMNMCNADATLVENICFTDESTFYLNGNFNHQNMRYYSRTNPRWMIDGIDRWDLQKPDHWFLSSFKAASTEIIT
jgi:hypothetical protein